MVKFSETVILVLKSHNDSFKSFFALVMITPTNLVFPASGDVGSGNDPPDSFPFLLNQNYLR